MNKIKFQKTYKGKTAGQWLKSAHISKTRAGTYEIFIGDFIAKEAEDGMVLNDGHGTVIGLECKKLAAEKLAMLSIECNRLMDDQYA